MDIFEKIEKDIMKDPDNMFFTERGIKPLYKVSRDSKIILVGQAPGRIAEETGLYWNDLSGDRLRDWMGISREIFYDSDLIAQMPMDFYYPGKAKSGDAPPRKGFAEKWHPPLLKEMPNIKAIILVGAYAQKYYLGENTKKTLTETVKSFEEFLPSYFPLVHPSPLNLGWLKKNSWFEEDILPVLKDFIRETLGI